MNKKIIIALEFLKWEAVIILLVFVAIFVHAKFFACNNGSCYTTQCVEIDLRCEESNYDPRTGNTSTNCCVDYETAKMSPLGYVLKNTFIYGVIAAGGIGLFVSGIMAEKKARQLE